MRGKSFILSAFLLVAGSSFAGPDPVLVPVPLDKAFVPIGFDDNDVSQLVVAGQFPDTCHKLGPTRVKVDGAGHVIWVEQMAYQYSDICLRMVVPFTQVVTVGILRASDYAVADATSQHTLAALPISRSKSHAADDYLYAPVTDAFIDRGASPKKHRLVVRGTFTDRCTTMKEIRVGYFGDTIVVQPITNYLPQATACGYAKMRFDYVVDLERELKGSYLLHVRVMNGQAINKVVETP